MTDKEKLQIALSALKFYQNQNNWKKEDLPFGCQAVMINKQDYIFYVDQNGIGKSEFGLVALNAIKKIGETA